MLATLLQALRLKAATSTADSTSVELARSCGAGSADAPRCGMKESDDSAANRASRRSAGRPPLSRSSDRPRYSAVAPPLVPAYNRGARTAPSARGPFAAAGAVKPRGRFKPGAAKGAISRDDSSSGEGVASRCRASISDLCGTHKKRRLRHDWLTEAISDVGS